MRDLILTILTSSVISSLIVVLCNVFLNQKKNTLEYITNERSLWRKEVREIAEEIGKADKDKLNVSLTKLKVRINIYDKFIPNKIDTGDSRLWKLIEICEKNSDPELFKILKEKLIMMLSLMLKYDWEKSKKEVTVNRNNLLCVICIIVQVILFWLISYLSIIKFSLCLFWMIFYIILLVALGCFTKFLDYKDVTENKVIGKINEYSLHCGFVIAVFVTTLLLVLVTRTPIVINGLEIENSIYKILFGISMLFPTQIYFILGVEKGVMSKYRINYLYSMDKIIEDIS